MPEKCPEKCWKISEKNGFFHKASEDMEKLKNIHIIHFCIKFKFWKIRNKNIFSENNINCLNRYAYKLKLTICIKKIIVFITVFIGPALLSKRCSIGYRYNFLISVNMVNTIICSKNNVTYYSLLILYKIHFDK